MTTKQMLAALYVAANQCAFDDKYAKDIPEYIVSSSKDLAEWIEAHWDAVYENAPTEKVYTDLIASDIAAATAAMFSVNL